MSARARGASSVGEASPPRPDLDTVSAPVSSSASAMRVEDPRIGEKVLAEALSRRRVSARRCRRAVAGRRHGAASAAQQDDREVVAPGRALRCARRACRSTRSRISAARRVAVRANRVEHALLAEALAGAVARVAHAVGEQHEQIAAGTPCRDAVVGARSSMPSGGSLAASRSKSPPSARRNACGWPVFA